MKSIRGIIRKEIRKILKETAAKRAVGEVYDEWKNVASNYNDIQEYFEELKETGGLEAFLSENKKPINKTKMIVKRLKEDTAYQEFFKKAMEKFKINTPSDLKDPVRKKEFFDYVDKNYKAKDETNKGSIN